MTPEQMRLESEIDGIVRDNIGTSGWMLQCAFAAQQACVTIDLGGWKRFSSVHLHGAHADIVNAIDVAGYTAHVVVLP